MQPWHWTWDDRPRLPAARKKLSDFKKRTCFILIQMLKGFIALQAELHTADQAGHSYYWE